MSDKAARAEDWQNGYERGLEAAAPEWQPIETAPRDGTPILMGKWHDGERYWIASGSIEGEEYWCDFPDDTFVPYSHQNPTHWALIPAPPPS